MSIRYVMIDGEKTSFNRPWCCPFFGHMGGKSFCNHPKTRGLNCIDCDYFSPDCPLKTEDEE